jgi:hypothetical protein
VVEEPGEEVYEVDAAPVRARGARYSEELLATTLRERVKSLVEDVAGRAEIEGVLADLPATTFESERLGEVLAAPPAVQWWQVGEALAEAFLVDHRSCVFPWPFSRDLRNPLASPAGADLVGFNEDGAGTRFAFGEVKSSDDADTPPQVMYGRSGLVAQIEKLRDDQGTKNALVRYLGFRAPQADWRDQYRTATSRFLADPNDVALFGVLIRDSAVDERDLKSRAAALAEDCPATTAIELRAKYLPNGSLKTLATRIGAVEEGGSSAGN